MHAMAACRGGIRLVGENKMFCLQQLWKFRVRHFQSKVRGVLSRALPFESLDLKHEKSRSNDRLLFVAGNEGFEPPITGPEPVALPLGQFPLNY